MFLGWSPPTRPGVLLEHWPAHGTAKVLSDGLLPALRHSDAAWHGVALRVLESTAWPVLLLPRSHFPSPLDVPTGACGGLCGAVSGAEGKGRVWLSEGTKGSFLRQCGLMVNKIAFGGREPCMNPKCYQALTVFFLSLVPLPVNRDVTTMMRLENHSPLGVRGLVHSKSCSS